MDVCQELGRIAEDSKEKAPGFDFDKRVIARECVPRTDDLVKMFADSAMAFAVVQESDSFPAHPVSDCALAYVKLEQSDNIARTSRNRRRCWVGQSSCLTVCRTFPQRASCRSG